MESPGLEFKKYARKPFVVNAVQITPENMAEAAKFIGDLREKEDGTPYILVDPRLVPTIERVYAGYWMTVIGDNVRCYRERLFEMQFELTEES